MAILLGIDTGGTYTDAVLYCEEQGVLSTAKSLTTKHDLSLGITDAAKSVLENMPNIKSKDIRLVSISTTLATNAIVESHGLPVGLIMIGQPETALDRAGLRQALGDDPVVFIAGGHTSLGEEKDPLDEKAVRAAIAQYKGKVSAFAISGFFAVRNLAHEARVRDIIRETCGLPVTCSHELSSNLDAPRRALTAVLNARLIPLLQHLIEAVQEFQKDVGIHSPLMVVKGDGSLISAETALLKPVETILSGPAASVIGAQHLAGAGTVFVSDIGGTTTDIALLKDGLAVLNKDGATVNGFRTMVEAVAVHTVGIGGDSEVSLSDEKKLTIGPRRAVPLSLLANQYDYIIPTLKSQLERGWRKNGDGRFAMRLREPNASSAGFSSMEQIIWDNMADGPISLETLLGRHSPEQPLRRLIDRGLVIISAFTPSDAAHVLGQQNMWNKEAADLGAAIWADTDIRPGNACATNAGDFANKVFELVIVKTGEALSDAAMAIDFPDMKINRGNFMETLFENSLSTTRATAGNVTAPRLLDFNLTLNLPIVGIGAPAITYYNTIADRLNTTAIIPKHAEVSNAIGAVAGGVSQHVSILISTPEPHIFRVHGIDNIKDYAKLDDAAAKAIEIAETTARQRAIDAGADDIRLDTSRKDIVAPGEDARDIFIESTIIATAIGRPRLAGAS